YKCKRGVRIVNCARGGLVNEQDLADALADGQVAAAGVDVFDVEPSYNRAPGEQEFDNVLLHAPNCVITPHLGASTQEATYNVGSQVSDLVARALEGELVPALNLPSISGDMEAIRPYTVLAEKIGLMYFQTETTPIKKISVTYRGELAAQSTELVTMSLLMGVLKGMGNDHASYVNVQENIEECGIEVEENSIEKIEKYNNLVVVKFTNEEGRELKINGTAFGETPVIVNFFGYAMNCPLFETVLAIKNNDVPGVIGRIATVLGRHNINIAAMNWGRKEGDENNNHAQAFVAVETPVNDKIIKEIEACDGVLKVSLIDFS
ncbi:MAG: ACT domain-containing protein, partial [Clostridiales bacterium]|nr:ACT domain-containing protein [Clostridiales bacterium]